MDPHASPLVMTVKLSIVTLTPSQLDLYFSTTAVTGKNCGERLEGELRDLAKHIRENDKDAMVSYGSHVVSLCCMLTRYE